MKKLVVWSALLLVTLGGCKNSSEEEKKEDKGAKKEKRESRKPEAVGEVGKMAMLADHVTYKECQDALDSVYRRPIEGLVTVEPYFRINQCDVDQFDDYFKYNHHLCILFQHSRIKLLRQALGSKMIDELTKKMNDGVPFVVLKDVYATPQEVTVVLGKTTFDLKKALLNNRKALLEIAQETERTTTRNVIIRGDEKDDEFYNNMMRRFGYAFRTPVGYTISVKSDEFNGINKDLGEKRAGAYISEEPYTGPIQFTTDYIVKRRNEILQKHLHGPDHPEGLPTYVTTDTVNLKVVSKETKINGFMAIETRGWWEMKNEYFGGPFVSYTVLCPSINKVITLEGIVFAPGEKKRVFLRQLELAMSTFEIKK